MKNETTNPTNIGKTIRDARLNQGFKTRASLVHTTKLKGKITQEGLRKVEEGDRVPRLETLQMLGEVLGLKKTVMKRLEHEALKMNIVRVARRTGNASVSFRIDGDPVKVHQLPPKRKTERFVRRVADELLGKLEKYGLGEQDLANIRMETRAILYNALDA